MAYSAVGSRHIFKDAPGLSREVHGQREELKGLIGFFRDACKMPAQRRRLGVEPKSKIYPFIGNKELQRF